MPPRSSFGHPLHAAKGEAFRRLAEAAWFLMEARSLSGHDADALAILTRQRDQADAHFRAIWACI